MKIRFVKPQGEYLPGQEVEMDADKAAWPIKSGAAVDADLADAQAKDVKGLTVAEMHDKNMKNVAADNLALHAEIEKKNQEGKPVASGEPLLPTGGVTPPTTVFPAMAKAAGHEVTDPSEVKLPKKDDKKADVKAADQKPAEVKPADQKPEKK